jgi:beta-agarase
MVSIGWRDMANGVTLHLFPRLTVRKPSGPIVFRQIRNRLSGKCLQPWGDGVDGAVITQRTCDLDEPRQKWRIDRDGTGTIVNFGTTACLDEWNGNPANGQLVIAWRCYAGAKGQRWRSVHKESLFYELRVESTDKCLDLAADNRNEGAVIQQWWIA